MPDSNYPGEEGHYNQNSPMGGKLPNRPPERRNGWKVATLILLITTLIFLATTVLAFNRTSTSTPSAHNTISTVAPTQVPQPTPTALATAAPTSALTPSSTPVAPGSLTPVPDGIIQENITLTCNGCNDPIRVTINTVRVDSANGRMIWDNTLKDVTGTNLNYSINTYALQDSTVQTAAVPAVFAQPSNTLVSNIPSSIQGVFAFVPSRNVTYVLSVVIYVSGITSVTFNPVKITF